MTQRHCQYLFTLIPMLDEELPRPTKCVIYLRKSEDDPNKQVRSIEDQHDICKDLAVRENLHVVETIQEERSARKSNNRPKFTEMIRQIKAEKFDCIIAWHPDRLARNMKEAGEIIDLLDEGFLLDLKFAAHRFTNDYNGKMALGIDFVLAKQYTDKLSIDVKRGIHKSLLAGKSGGQFRAGYVRSNRTGLYEPDETRCDPQYTRFGLVRKAWEMRLDGTYIRNISDFMNKRGYNRTYKSRKEGAEIMTSQKLSMLFKNSFYYGQLVQGGQSVFLPGICDFTPMITEVEYQIVQSMGRNDLKVPKKHFYPFRSLLLCDKCGKTLAAGASKPRSGDKILYYWCSHSECRGASIRAKDIIKYITRLLGDLRIDAKLHYPLYLEKAFSLKKERRAEHMSQKMAAIKKQAKVQRDYEELVIAGSKVTDVAEKQIIERRKMKYIEDLNKLSEELARIESLVVRGNAMEPKEFLNHLKTLSTSFLSGDPTQKDEIARNVFLNLRIKKNIVASRQLNEPFQSMSEEDSIQNGGPAWT